MMDGGRYRRTMEGMRTMMCDRKYTVLSGYCNLPYTMKDLINYKIVMITNQSPGFTAPVRLVLVSTSVTSGQWRVAPINQGKHTLITLPGGEVNEAVE